MGRQTDQKNMVFPDGFKMEIDPGTGYVDVGILEGGATATFNWDTFYLDAGNYEGLVDKARNPRVALAPSNVWNWDPSVIELLFPGFLEEDDTQTSPVAGSDIDYKGDDHQVTLDRVAIRLTHKDSDDNETWQFTLHHARVDAGGSFTFKGVNEDGLNEISVSFEGKPDPGDEYKLFKFFKAD